jgi:imidazolonepropionase-like amidohydrolase
VEVLRMEGEVGTVEPGKLADLVVLDSDPMADTSAP